MKDIMNWAILFMACIAQVMTGCDKQVAIPERDGYQKLYIPQAARGTVTVAFTTGETLPDTVAFGAAVGGFDVPASTIAVRFEVASDAVDAYNTANHTDYPLLPSDALTLLDETVDIPAGQINSPLSKVVIDPQALEDDAQYLLPIRLVEVSRQIGRYSEEIHTLFIIVTVAPAPPVYHEDLDRTGWEVASYSSHDPWEGGAEGHANSVLDGNFYTFWISKWMDGELPLPHHIVIDMRESHTLHGISFMNRTFWDDYSNGQPKAVAVELSADGETWEAVKEFSDIPAPEAGAAPAGNWIRLEFDEEQDARYFKFIVTEIHGTGSVTSVAELGAF